jgi:DNA polymerase-3 subunit delta'
LQQTLSLRPVEGHAVVARIPDAERLTPQAQNALLKTLEEPPPRAAIVLLAAAPRSLIDTVRSRCTAVRFPPMAERELMELARGGGSGDPAALAVASAGHPAALQEAAEAGAEDALAPLVAAFRPASGGVPPLAGVDEVMQWVRTRGRTLDAQRGRLRWALRLLMAAHLPGNPRGLSEAAVAPFASLGEGARAGRLDALCEARERIERNVDPAGILEALATAVAMADRSVR